MAVAVIVSPSSNKSETRSSGMICPRYCTTCASPAHSTISGLNSSSRATSERSIAMRPSAPHWNSNIVWRSPVVEATCRSLSLSARSRLSLTTLEVCATPSTSRISATRPSPMIVAPAKRLDALELLAERLDDDFLGVVDLVDDQAELALVGLEHDDVDGGKFRAIGRFVFDLEFAIEVNERQQAAAQAVHGNALDELDALLRVFAVETHQFEQTDLRDGVAVAAAGDDQRGNDRERERDFHAHGSAGARFRLHIDGAADFFDVGFDHVHADAAAGDVGDFFRGGKSGQENQIDAFALAHARGLLRRDQAFFDGFAANPCRRRGRRRRRRFRC